jgi:peptide/nickel transport system permease protein
MTFMQFLAARLGKALIVVFGVVVINFFLIRMAPGDPATVMAGEAGAGDALYVSQLRTEFGLDKPVLIQLGHYLSGVAKFDLGYSYRNRLPVIHLILERLPATLLLMSCSFAFSLALGVVLGVVGARCKFEGKRRWLDNLISNVSLILYATPLFWLSLMAVILFSVVLGWLPAYGMQSVDSNMSLLARCKDIALHLILPTISLGCFYMAVYVRMMRNSMLEVLGMDFVKTARAKGVPIGRVMRVHAMRNALLPIVTFAGIQLGQMAGGAVLTETVFAWPGIGRLMLDALMQRDYQLLLGIFFMTSVMVVVFNLLTDIVYRMVDPRIASGVRSAS